MVLGWQLLHDGRFREAESLMQRVLQLATANVMPHQAQWARTIIRHARDRVTLDLTAQSLDKKDLFSESDPFYIVYRRNPNSSETLVYRSG